MNYLFELKICYPNNVIKMNTRFSGETREAAFGLARRWMRNCLVIYENNEQNRRYLDAELVCLTKESDEKDQLVIEYEKVAKELKVIKNKLKDIYNKNPKICYDCGRSLIWDSDSINLIEGACLHSCICMQE